MYNIHAQTFFVSAVSLSLSLSPPTPHSMSVFLSVYRVHQSLAEIYAFLTPSSAGVCSPYRRQVIRFYFHRAVMPHHRRFQSLFIYTIIIFCFVVFFHFIKNWFNEWTLSDLKLARV